MRYSLARSIAESKISTRRDRGAARTGNLLDRDVAMLVRLSNQLQRE
jgi:hypothetical protein